MIVLMVYLHKDKLQVPHIKDFNLGYMTLLVRFNPTILRVH